jgi:lipoprotein-releasing system permease protein
MQKPAIIQVNGQMEGLALKGINKSYKPSPAVGFTGNKIDFSDTAYSRQIILSQATADKLNINVGDTVQVNFVEKGSMFPRIRKVKVVGFYHTGMNEEIDRRYGLCDMRLLQRMNQGGTDDISGYQVDLDDERYSDTVSNVIYEYLRSPRYINSSLTSYTMHDIFPNIYDWLSLLDVNVRIILIIMAIVAIINLASVLMILIVEQARVVGLLKAMGMAFGDIQRIFLYHAGIIAGWGILAGNILALLLCWLQIKTGFIKLSEDSYSIKEVAIRLQWWEIALVDVFTLAICLMCMWLPTLYVKRIKPIRVLQFK